MKTATLVDSGPRGHSKVLERLSDRERRIYQRIPQEVDYIPNDCFSSAGTEEELFGEAAPKINAPVWTQFSEVPEDASSKAPSRGTLKRQEEQRLFLKYNYALYRLSKLIEAQGRRAFLTRARAEGMVLWFDRAMKVRSDLVGANMALVPAMAKRTRIPNAEFSEMISEGNMALLRSVEKFDVSRGFKFSTYACRAILKSFNRLATKTSRYRRHFPTEYEPKFERSDYDVKKHEMQRDDSIETLRDILVRNLANLTDLEHTIIMERFAIGSHRKRRTLADVGREVGLTNERVRQIQNLALAKIRAVLDEQ
ncbi:MAG: sigma-70 family RNA polymerase sigma factor, partial [Phycisphaerae bacterium]|nr:sigma-70 family RNA polymerase sigma factor [Phycisphaerae bacterium]